MKFKKEIKLTIEGQVSDGMTTPEDIFKSLRFSWRHWWQSSNNWPYGTPSQEVQKGCIEKIFFEDQEITNS